MSSRCLWGLNRTAGTGDGRFDGSEACCLCGCHDWGFGGDDASRDWSMVACCCCVGVIGCDESWWLKMEMLVLGCPG